MACWRLALLFAGVGLVGCGSSGTDPTPTGPDHDAVNEVRARAVTHVDRPYTTEVPTLFRTTAQLPDLDVRALLISGGSVYAGTASGMVVLAAGADRFERVAGSGPGAIYDLAELPAGVAGATADGVVLPPRVVAVPGLRAITSLGGKLYAATDRALLEVTGVGASTVAAYRSRESVRDLAGKDGVLYVGTASAGVMRFEVAGAERTRLAHPGGGELRALHAADAIYAGTDEQLAALSGEAWTSMPAAIGGWPTDRFRAIGGSARDKLIVGHAIGASTLTGADRYEHYHSQRWIPAEEVTAVALDADGTRWIATHAGISRIRLEQTTLAAKAALFEEHANTRHWRMDGFLDDGVELRDPWDLSTTPITDDNDNDGLWTEMQIGAWCYAYAVTKDERYYQRARRAMDVMFLEFDVPAVTFEKAGKKRGFITRSLVRDDEGAVFESKKTQSNWHREEFGGRTYYWKDDTSSDEYAGHYWGIPIFYDLCAKTEAEKDEIRRRIRESTDYLIAGGYFLIDLDGERTTHGHWRDLGIAVDGLDQCTATHELGDCVDSWGGGGWLNGMEILGHLLAAWHITGDQKYYDEYDRLWTTEKYGRLVPIVENILTLTDSSIANHSDHELAMLAYSTLWRYEPNPNRKNTIAKSLRDFYEYEREEHNPWQIAVIGTANEQDVDLAGAVRTLMDMPSDWRTWLVDNAHRKDARRGPNDRHRNPQFTRVFPYDEIRTMKWNGNPYSIRDGGSGREVLIPTPWLIAYWMMRYNGQIVE